MPNPIERQRDLVDALVEENRQLRLAADAFGQLAERLNDELRRLRVPQPEPATRAAANRPV